MHFLAVPLIGDAEVAGSNPVTLVRTQRQVNRAIVFCGIVALGGIGQFVYSTVVAIEHYGCDYSITSNFLSDLGRTKTVGGGTNTVSAAIFNRGAILLGVSLLPFFGIRPSVVEKYRKTMRSSGILSSAGLIGIGLTPYDQYYVAHNMALG
jgi:hypothetical membrane protein